MGLSKRRLAQIDLDTGEIIEGQAFLIGNTRGLMDHHAMLTTPGLLMIATDRDLKYQDLRVLFAYLGAMDFENIIDISQKNVAELLGVKKESVSRSTKKLVSKNILIEETKLGRSKIYRLNVVIGWKGRVTKVYDDLYETDSRLIVKV